MTKKQREQLRKWIEDNSIKDEDKLIFEEQDSMSFAMNLERFLFLNKIIK